MCNMSLKVLLLDPDNFTPLYDIQLSKALTELGWQVVWMTSTPQFDQIRHTHPVKVEKFFFRMLKRRFWRVLLRHRHLRTVRWLAKAVGYLWGLCLLHIRLCRQVPGIIHVQWALFPWVDCLLWKTWRRRGWVVVFTCHDPLPLSGSLPKYFEGVTRRLCLAPDGVIVHGEWARQTLKTWGIPTGGIHVIEPGASMRSQPMRRDQARHLLKLDPRDPVMLFFGFIKPYKGLAILLDALPRIQAELERFQLLVAGEPMESVSEYQNRLTREGLAGHVQWAHGYLSEKESRWHFAAANVVVLPYLEASSSAVLLQAYSAGRPVVASAVGDIPHMIEDGATGLLVPPKDPAALATAIVRILKDREMAEEMGTNAMGLLKSRFNWSRAAERTGALYSEMFRMRFQ